MDRIVSSGVATLAAAPGAGKTVFAGMVFESLRELGVVDRMVVFVPRRSLVEQWTDSLHRNRHLQLKPFIATERPGQQVGSVVTYQSLRTRDQLDAHRQMADRRRTLLVFDEAHHLGERTSGVQLWARNIAELAGEIGNLNVPGVLNLSGTLWRSAPTERISTVRYRTVDEGRLQSEVDFEVTTEELVQRGQLRPIDLYRLDIKIRLSDFRDLAVIEGLLSDLDEHQTRATVGNLGTVSNWRSAFVSAVIDRLEKGHRALDGHHAKALIVATRQDQAAAFRDEVDRQLRERGLSRLAALAISDEKDAPAVLKNFRAQKRPGVLCTVDMAGEGYDCPNIAVIGFASNKLTPLYVRQVIARGMRVTDRERHLGIVIPAAVVLPDAGPLVKQLVAYLAPFTAEVLVPDADSPEVPQTRQGEQSDMLNIPTVRYGLEDAVLDSQLVTVPYADKSQEDIDTILSERLGIELEKVGLAAIWAPRFIAASRRTVGDLQQSRPFDKLGGDAMVLEALTKGIAAVERGPREPVQKLDIAEEDQAAHLQAQLRTCAG